MPPIENLANGNLMRFRTGPDALPSHVEDFEMEILQDWG